MNSRLKIGVALGLLLAGAVGVFAQTALSPRSLTGAEVFEGSAGAGGGSFFVPSFLLRNSQGVATTAITTGTLSTLTSATATLVSTAASVSVTVNLPALPPDGQIFEWINGSAGAFTAGTVAITDGATAVNFGTIGALAAGASVEYRYVQATNSWYRTR